MTPTLIYDGRCSFCKIWVNYWRVMTGDQVLYAPSQDVGAQYPQISTEDFKRSVWLVYPDGERFSGAEAVFRLMAHVRGKRWPLLAYQHVAGFRFLTESAYNFIAGHRSLFYWVTRILWGRKIEPASYRRVRSVLLRGLGIVYLLAFGALLPQILGLIGEHGILPARSFLESIESQIGAARYQMFPTLAWLNSSDTFLRGMCWAGIALSVALLIRVFPIAAVLGLFALYLSMDTVGQTFLSFQWDALLLEAGFAAILLTPLGMRPRYTTAPSRVGIWVMRFLAFRLMLESGLVKLLSGDPTWRNLTALTFHYETQPLPTPLSWYAHHLPVAFQTASVAGVFAVELGVPFLFLMPRLPRIIGAWITIVFQLIIAATGNYTFFNVLTILLCFSLFDDQHLGRFIPALQRGGTRGPYGGRRRAAYRSDPEGGPDAKNHPVAGSPAFSGEKQPIQKTLGVAAGALLIGIGVVQLVTMFGVAETVPEPVSWIVDQAAIHRVVNQYGLFAVMTTSRPEIVIEGSNDGLEWKAYEFKFKPGDVDQAPRWVAPYHPRLDWQMWFAALSNYRSNRWFSPFMLRLLEGSPDVLGLLAKNPFPDKPPHLVRAVIYEYHFSDVQTRRSTGAWWTRQPLGVYFPAASLRQ
jgi:lipase maturation factor 1